LLDQNSKNKTRSIIGLAIEKALLELGTEEGKNVVKQLDSNYQCYLFDIFDNPQHLKQILYKLYPTKYSKILHLIEKQLKEFSENEPIKYFINYMKEPKSEGA